MTNKSDDRLRMEGTTQSYNVYDSLAFNSTKILKEILDNNKDYSLTAEDCMSKSQLNQEKNEGEGGDKLIQKQVPQE